MLLDLEGHKVLSNGIILDPSEEKISKKTLETFNKNLLQAVVFSYFDKKNLGISMGNQESSQDARLRNYKFNAVEKDLTEELQKCLFEENDPNPIQSAILFLCKKTIEDDSQNNYVEVSRIVENKIISQKTSLGTEEQVFNLLIQKIILNIIDAYKTSLEANDQESIQKEKIAPPPISSLNSQGSAGLHANHSNETLTTPLLTQDSPGNNPEAPRETLFAKICRCLSGNSNNQRD